MKLDKSMSFDQIKESIKSSIKKIKKEHYENYLIHYYKNKKLSKKIKNLKLTKTKSRHLKYAPL